MMLKRSETPSPAAEKYVTALWFTTSKKRFLEVFENESATSVKQRWEKETYDRFVVAKERKWNRRPCLKNHILLLRYLSVITTKFLYDAG